MHARHSRIMICAMPLQPMSRRLLCKCLVNSKRWISEICMQNQYLAAKFMQSATAINRLRAFSNKRDVVVLLQLIKISTTKKSNKLSFFLKKSTTTTTNTVVASTLLCLMTHTGRSTAKWIRLSLNQ